MVVESERARERKYMLTKASYDYTVLAKISGYLNDPRFVQPLIEALDKPQNFERKVVIEALVRMRVEPYYSDYVKRRTRTIEQIKSEQPRFKIEELIYVIGTQDAFLELSKYLLSDVTDLIIMDDYSTDHADSKSTEYPISMTAFYLIQDHIENEDLQEMIKGKSWREPLIFHQIYNWMQANYGKYKIRRLW
jgi:hypothetical protein